MVGPGSAIRVILTALIGFTACSHEADLLETGSSRYRYVLRDGMHFPWQAGVRRDARIIRAVPGETYSVPFDLAVDLRQYVPGMGRFKKIIAVVYGELRFDAEGAYRSGPADFALTSNHTAGGMPIVGTDLWPWVGLIHGRNGSPFEGSADFELPDEPGDVQAVHRFSGRIDIPVPADIPRGWWHPRMALLVEVEGAAQPLFLAQFYELRKQNPYPSLPLVEIDPGEPPLVPWTAFPLVRHRGQAGTLPLELNGKVSLVPLVRFPAELVLPPGMHPVGPGNPMNLPAESLPLLFGPDTHLPTYVDAGLFQEYEVSATIDGPSGQADLGTWSGTVRGEAKPDLIANMIRTGTYEVRLTGHVKDMSGRSFKAGGTYLAHVALPLTFSTSCKPGTSFLVGNAYPGKVNLNPPVPGDVEVLVTYLPQSDPGRVRTWVARGKANRFGHFTPDVPPLIFDEPGEYVSVVRATYRGSRGMDWMGIQTSTGVVAPAEPDPAIRLRPGSRRLDGGRYKAWDNGAARYEDRILAEGLLFQNQPPFKAVKAPNVPMDPADSLLVSVAISDNFAVEPRYSIDIADPELARRIRDAETHGAYVPPRAHQRRDWPWIYLRDIMLAGTSPHGLVWTASEPDRNTDMPITPVSGTAFHPSLVPDESLVDAWVVFGAVRPGIPVLTGLANRNGALLSWTLNPNPFGMHINAGYNGDLPGDVYRIQAGVMLRDKTTGKNHYDLHSAAVAFVQGKRPAQSIVPPGARPLVSENGRDHYIFLATDTHDGLEVGESLGGGGMVFPNIPADVTWTVTKPDGEVIIQRAKADRRGIVRATPSVPLDMGGKYGIQVTVSHGELRGGIPGTANGDYWICAVPGDNPTILQADTPPMSRIDPDGTVRIPLTWPGHLRDVTIHFGVIMPGQVLEQGTLRPEGSAWTYAFTPMEAVIRFPNFDVRQHATGIWELADTVVFQFCLEARDGDERVVDGLRMALRADTLMSFQNL